jgi:hypothetical protein
LKSDRAAGRHAFLSGGVASGHEELTFRWCADCKASRAYRLDGRCFAVTCDGETVCEAEER